MRTLLRTFLLVFAVLSAVFVGACFATGCTTSDQALMELQAQAASLQPPAPGVPTLTPDGVLQAAPTYYTQAQAKQYYLAQLRAQAAATPRKVKNSNNTTQQIQNGLSTPQLLLFALAIFLTGAGFGGLLMSRLRP